MMKARSLTKKQGYQAGSWVAIPLKDSQYGLGLVARSDSTVGAFVGYYFSKMYESMPTLEDVRKWKSQDAVLIRWTSGLGITEGRWTVIGKRDDFDILDWPVPKFWRLDNLVPYLCWLVEYFPEGQGSARPPRETLYITRNVLGTFIDYPFDGTSGHLALEISLSDLLSRKLV